jgi:SAM-dependent methyltransferase
MPTASSIPVSDPRVLTHFDASTHLYVNKQLECYKDSVEQRLQMLRRTAGFDWSAELQILDVGCGAGMFLDLFLERYPNAIATGIDLSPEMLRLNTPSSRKTTFVGDALSLPSSVGDFDVICIDTVMHHLISADGYQDTIQRISLFLQSLQRLLRPGGVVLVREIFHEYMGFKSFGSRAIYEISTLKVPEMIASVIKRAGIQTANAGVCFLTRPQWQKVFAGAGFLVSSTEDHVWPGQPYRKVGFSSSGDVHYILRPSRPRV